MALGSMDDSIEVAVVGGGMSGLCLAIGLLKYPHIKVQIYEAAKCFSEIGAGVAFGPNAQRALRLIGPETEEAFMRVVTHNAWEECKNTWFEWRWGYGPHEGELISAPKNETGQTTVHRAKFLDELVKLVPDEIAHFDKRLVRLERLGNGRVALHFEDGTVGEADAVVGAEGIHSVTRRHVLGEDHLASSPKYSGAVWYRGLIPMKEAVAAIGERYAQNSVIWVGEGAAIMIYSIEGGDVLNVAAVNYFTKTWDGPWIKPVTFDKIAEEYVQFGGTAKAVIKLLDRLGTSRWSIWEHESAPTYFKDHVAMIGDAAHAMTPFQGQGAGQAITDALVLARLFGCVDEPEKIPLAFQAFDAIRRPRTQRVSATSREGGYIATLQDPPTMNDPESLKQALDTRMDWIWNEDLEIGVENALAMFEKLSRSRLDEK